MLKKICTGVKPVVCQGCEKAYLHLLFVRGVKKLICTHKQIHTGHEPFLCDVCSKSFSYRGDLSVNKKIHTGQKTFLCGKAFCFYIEQA